MNLKTDKKASGLADFWESPYFPALDGLRAICILLVIFNHTRCYYPAFIHGWVGVDIFFVLSGFLITTLLVRERESYGNLSLKGFYTRRAFRILPVYFVVLAVYLAVIPLLHDWKRWEEMKVALPYLLTFTQEFRPASAGNIYNQTWSLGFEEKFYLAWPLIVLISFPFRTRKILALIAVASLILLLPAQAARSYGGLFFGALLGILLDKSGPGRPQRILTKVPTSAAFAAVLATYVLAVGRPSLILLFSLATAFFTATLVVHKGFMRRVLEHPIMVLFGKRSYAMYLVHILVLDGIEAAAQKMHLDLWYIVVPLTYLASFAGAMVLFHWIERPCVAHGRKLSRGMREQLGRKLQLSIPYAEKAGHGVAVIEREEAGVPRAF